MVVIDFSFAAGPFFDGRLENVHILV